MSKTPASNLFDGMMSSLDIDVDKWLQETDQSHLGNHGGESEYISLDDFGRKFSNQKSPSEITTSSYSRSMEGQDVVYKCSYCDYKNKEEYEMLCHCARLHVDEDFNNTMLNINETAAKWGETISLGSLGSNQTKRSSATVGVSRNESDSDDDGMHIMNPLSKKNNDLSSVKSSSGAQNISQTSELNKVSDNSRQESVGTKDVKINQEKTVDNSLVSCDKGNISGAPSNSTSMPLPAPPVLVADALSDGKRVGGDIDTPKTVSNSTVLSDVAKEHIVTSLGLSIQTSAASNTLQSRSSREKSGRIPMAVALTPSWVSTPPASNAPSFLASKTITSQTITTSTPTTPIIPSPPPLVSHANSGLGFLSNPPSSLQGAVNQAQTIVSGTTAGLIQNWQVPNKTSTTPNLMSQGVHGQSSQTSLLSQRQPPSARPPFLVENQVAAHVRGQATNTIAGVPTRYPPPVAHQQQMQAPRVNGSSFTQVQQAMQPQNANLQPPSNTSQLIQQQRSQASVSQMQAMPFRVQQHTRPVQHQTALQMAQNIQLSAQRQAQAQGQNQPLPQSAYQFHFYCDPSKQQPGNPSQRPSILRHNRNQQPSTAQPRHSPPVSSQGQPNFPTTQNNIRFQQLMTNQNSQSMYQMGQGINMQNVAHNSFNPSILQAGLVSSQSSRSQNNSAVYQKAVQQVTASATTAKVSKNVSTGGSMNMNNQASNNQQFKLSQTADSGQKNNQNQRSKATTVRQIIGAQGGISSFPGTVATRAPRSAQTAANSAANNNTQTSNAANPMQGGTEQDGRLYMMKQCGQGYVLTPYGEKQGAGLTPSGSTARIDINLLQNVKDSVADPTLLAYLNGREVPKNIKFKCKLCNAKTESLNMIRWHLYAHHLQSAPRPFKCVKCPESFFSEKHAQDHARDIHHIAGKCHMFDETITQIAQKHSATMFKVYAAIVKESDESKEPEQKSLTLIECQICQVRTVDVKSMHKHMQDTHNPFKAAEFQCWYCPECSNVEETLKEHVKKVHANQPPQYTRDTPPGKKREKITNRLMEFFKQVPFSSTAVKSFTITENQPENPEESELITCPLCKFVSVQNVALENHLKNDHLPFKPYLCHGNDYKAATIKMLKKHLAAKHVEWLQSGSLHKRVSIDGELSACQDRETSRWVLKALLKGLENAVDFCSTEDIHFDNICSECQYKASTHTMMETHVKLRHLTLTPHICGICGVATALPESMRNHVRTKHPVEKFEDIVFTDEAGERLQSEEAQKIIIQSICKNSDDQNEELPAEPDPPEAEADKSVDEITSIESAEELPKAPDKMTASDLLTSLADGTVNDTAVQSATNISTQPSITPAFTPIPNISPALVPVPIQPVQQSPMLLLPVVSLPQTNMLSTLTASAGAPTLPSLSPVTIRVETPSGSIGLQSEPEPMISAAVVRVKKEPGLEETDKSCIDIRSRISEFLNARPGQTTADQNTIGNNTQNAEKQPDLPNPVMYSLGTIPVASSREIPATNNFYTSPIPVATSREIPATNNSYQSQDIIPVATSSELPAANSNSILSTTSSNSSPALTETVSAVVRDSPQIMLTVSDPQDSQGEESIATQEEQHLDRVDASSAVVSQSLGGGEMMNRSVSVITDEDLNAVVISIPEAGQSLSDINVETLDAMPIQIADVNDKAMDSPKTLDSLQIPAAKVDESATKSLKTNSAGCHITSKTNRLSSLGNISDSMPTPTTTKTNRVSSLGDMSSVTSLFTGEQMKETLGKPSPSQSVPPLSSPPMSSTTPDSTDMEKAFKCHKCEDVFPSRNEVRQHFIESHLSEYWQFYCEKCDFRTWNHPLMREHMKSVHDSSDFVKSDRKRYELLQAELKEMQNMVKTVLVPKKKTAASDDVKKAVKHRMLSTKDMSMGNIKKRLQFRKQKSQPHGSKSPIVISPNVLNAPLDRIHGFDKGAGGSEDPDFIGTCWKCQRYRQESPVEVMIPLIHVTVVNEKECLFRCNNCDFTSTKLPLLVFHIWSHTNLKLYHCGLCMSEGNEKKEMAAHCCTKHNNEVALHSIRLFKSIVKLLEKRLEKVSSSLQEHCRKRPVIASPEDFKQTGDIKKASFKCSYCIFQRTSILEVIAHEQEMHSVKMTKVIIDFRCSMDNGVTERLHRGTRVKSSSSAAAGENSKQDDESGGKSNAEKHVMMKINLKKGKRKAIILSESSNSSSEDTKLQEVKKRRDSHPRESRSKECHLCDFTSDSNKDLEHHLLSKHTTIRPYECSKCKKAYLVKEDARKHIQKHHSSSVAKLVIIKQMEVIMNEARLQMMKYAKQKQAGGHPTSTGTIDGSQGQPYKRLKLNNDVDISVYGETFNDPKLGKRPIVRLKDVTKSKHYKRFLKKKHKH